MDDLTKAIMADEANLSYTERGIFPLYDAPQTARLIIVGQAPGIVAQETNFTGMIVVASAYETG
ncbi:uracil DNA glycosylase superfamily protein [Streptococcus pyogenes]|nr:uracil DNA glycosylase superfamily protein [Streptococcus pyogenes]